jgi:hypothetical protein
MNPQTRALLITLRQAILLVLGAIEDYLGMERSVIPKHLRD